MFGRLLVANRGEIACRVMRTARRLGVRSIAVYSDADASALHVAEADEAVRLGPAPAGESYLSVERVIAAARDGGADALHPGYGFLSENAALADACAAAGIVFVGPSPAAIRRMGSKIEAKRLAAEAGVPVVPGYSGVSQSRSDLRSAADEVGYPVMIKADAGGGGRGMRVVRGAAGFDDALESASREAKAAFGDGRVLLERYIEKPRHIEVQVFGDGAGDAVHLFERDCSVQRRHQKVVEEAPALGLPAAVRDGLHRAAVDLARAMDYGGAGTVEFIVGDDGGFYFLEMNTRLQVEHPVTEMITGLDLVEWQLRVAAGEGLPLAQKDIRRKGHAVEVRLYAEDPARDFLPSTGALAHLRLPAPADGCRVDTGVRAGDTVTRFYDPMIAKIVAGGADRETALSRLDAALAETEVAGVRTNRAFLAAIVAHPAFRAAQPDTGFIARHMEELQAAARLPLDDALMLAAFAEMESRTVRVPARDGDPYSPWDEIDAWRLFGKGRTRLLYAAGGRVVTVRVTVEDEFYRIGLPDRRVRVEGRADREGRADILIDGERRLRGRVVVYGDARDARYVIAGRRDADLLTVDADAPSGKGETAAEHLTAPLPASVTAVHVAAGDTVARGDPLMVLEAMKMEHVIAAPADGRVTAVHYKTGDQVDEGAELIGFEQGEGEAR